MIKNNSNVPIVVRCGAFEVSNFLNYPDTTLPPSGPDFKSSHIIKGERAIIVSHKINVGNIFSIFAPNDILSIYVFDSDTLSTYTWEEIGSDYKVAVRYDLSRCDINEKSSVAIIPFPPNQSMKHVHMYPSYSEVKLKYTSD